MLNKFYRVLIQPKSTDPDTRSREVVLNYTLLGLLFLSLFELITSLFVFLFLDQEYTLHRLFGMSIVISLFAFLYWLARSRRKQRLISFIVVILLLFIGIGVAATWGTVTPTGVLLFGFIITLSGILLNSRYALYTTIVISTSLLILETLKNEGILIPDQTWMNHQSSTSDVLGFSILYAIIALVSWLFNRQMEQSLERAQKSEAALEKQNDLLELKVEERTRQLEAAQLEKLQQVYRFAELGRISSALFHDLANHLTSVSLNIENYNSREQSGLMQRVQHDIGYIDEVVQRVRLQLRGEGSIERFNIAKEIEKVSKILNYKLVQNHIKLDLRQPSKPIMITTDLIPFRQIISNLLSNAIDAYEHTPGRKRRRIVVEVKQVKDQVYLSVTDWGIGIPPEMGSRIFDPFYSSKTDGTGIGLFIVKQIVEHDLRGVVELHSDPQTGTTFTVMLPKK